MFSAGSHHIGGDIELLLRREVQHAGDGVCDAGSPRDVAVPSGE